MTDFVEIVLVQLADKTGEIAVFEVLGKDVLCEFLVLSLGQQVCHDIEGPWRILPGRRNCRRHFPIVLHSRRSRSPAS